MLPKTEVSIIIPCYDEESILEKHVREIKEIMDITRLNYEIILIDDKSKDKTIEIAKKIVEGNKNFRLICHTKNVGRGGTVAEGIKIAKGSIVGFTDIDLSTSAVYIISLIREIQKGSDIASAHRIYNYHLNDFSIIHRWISHKAYRLIVKTVFKTKLKDTETGCKFFRRSKILPMLDKIKDKHWFWDTEVMVISYYKGLKITEVPSLFIKKKEIPSSLKFMKDTSDYIRNVIIFRRELKRKKLI